MEDYLENPKPKFRKRKPKIGRCMACFYGYGFCKPKLPRKLKKKYYKTVFNHIKYMHWQFGDSWDYCSMDASVKYMRGLMDKYKFFERYKKALEVLRESAEDAGETIYIDDNGRLAWYWEEDGDYSCGSGTMPICYNEERAKDTWAFDALKGVLEYVGYNTCPNYTDDFEPETDAIKLGIKSDKDLLKYVERLMQTK